MTTGLAANNDGTGALQLNGSDVLAIDTSGRLTSTFGIIPRSISANNILSPLTWNSLNYDQYSVNALANSITILADANPSPLDGQRFLFRFKDNGSIRPLAWTTGSTNSFRPVGIVLPTITVANKTMYVGCIYNANAARWDAVSVSQEA